MHDKIKKWFLKESLVFAFELNDITYDDFLEIIKDVVSEQLQENEARRQHKKETFHITHLQNEVYENLKKGTSTMAIREYPGTSTEVRK